VISSHRLIITKSNGLVLLKFDSKSGEVISVSDAVSDPIKRPKIIIDHSNEDNFLIYNFASFASGSLEDDKIVLGPVQQFNIDFLKCPKLIGNNIYGFGSLVQNEDGDRFIQYLKVDLITLTKETIEVPFNLNDDRVILNLKVDIILLYLILNKFRIVNTAGLELYCMLSFVIKIIGYINYLMIFLTVLDVYCRIRFRKTNLYSYRNSSLWQYFWVIS
jgi:hypothetical protein